MHIQIITFSLEGLSEQDYLQLIESTAPAFAELPGLVSKTWLANAQTNTYGGVYLWQDRESMEGYPETDVFKQMAANPYLKDFTMREFDVPEGPSRITRGLAQASA
jgi:heme-degrading monooxygenase HmoA